MGLRDFMIRRVIQLVFVFWAFMTILFLLFRVLPGDPTTAMALEGLDEEGRQQITEQFGLDQPLYVQYFEYMRELILNFNLGRSYQYNAPVSDIIVHFTVNTVALMIGGLLISYLIGFFLGSAIGWSRGSRLEKFGMIYALAARSSPTFFIGIILLAVFSLWLGWFPSGGIGRPGTAGGGWGRFFTTDFLWHVFLPVVTMGLFFSATPTLLMRSTMLEILNEDFIEVERAQGLPEWQILYRHAARNSLLPIVTLAAISTGNMFGGSVIVETVFNWPGMGRAMVEAVNNNDYPLAQGTFFLMGTIVIVMNFIADILYVYLDPRVEYE